MTDETYVDKCGHRISREEAVREAIDTILRQGDAEPIVREHVEYLSRDELMNWIVYPDTGEFSDYLHRSSAQLIPPGFAGHGSHAEGRHCFECERLGEPQPWLTVSPK